MDTKKLAALAAAVRLGSFTRAAEELGYTQSGLTHMMNSLEKDVGFPVLVRSRSGVRLTPAGQRIFPLVQECLAGAEALEREILLINTHQEESVRVAAYDSIARHWLPEVIQQFRRIHPELTVDIQTSRLLHNLTERGGLMEIKYSIAVEHVVTGRNCFKIRVRAK